MKAALILIAVLLLLTGCRTYGPGFDPYQTENPAAGQFEAVNLTNRVDNALLKPPSEPYRLGPGDVIEVESVGDGAGRAVMALGPDGKVYYSLLPGVSLWGLSLAEARLLLQQEMAKYTRAAPELVVHLRTVGSQRFWLLGAVRAPGVYGLAAPTTLLDALAASGGVPVIGADDGADLSRSFVLRNGRLLPVDFARLLKEGDLSQNIFILPDDFLFLSPVEAPSVYVLGAVGAPNIIPYSRDLTVAGAILSVGGTVKFAQQNKVVIIRGSLSRPQIAEVPYQSIVTGHARNLLLQPGDIVYVPFTPFRRVAQMAEDILNQFVRTVAVNEGTALGSGEKQAVGASQGFVPPAN